MRKEYTKEFLKRKPGFLEETRGLIKKPLTIKPYPMKNQR